MKRTVGMLTALCVVTASVWAKPAAKVAVWPKYTGAWFDVSYPPGFKVRASQISPSSGDKKAESAFFTAPDGSVEFYVFSPQWNGDPKDIARKPTEVAVSQKTQKTRHTKLRDGSYLYEITTRWLTVRAKNNSYTRSWRDVETTSLNTRYVFGYKYRDQKAYRKHLGQYTRFNRSLMQYADH